MRFHYLMCFSSLPSSPRPRVCGHPRGGRFVLNRCILGPRSSSSSVSASPRSSSSPIATPDSDATRWMKSRQGMIFRVLACGAMTMSYPLYVLLERLFGLNPPTRTSNATREFQLSDETKQLIEEEYRIFLDEEKSTADKKPVEFSIADSLDAKTTRTLEFGTGLKWLVALPFYTQFTSKRESLDYCKQYLEPLNAFARTACVLWDSEEGRQLADTFVLSEGAKRYVIARELRGINREPPPLEDWWLVIVACATFMGFLFHWRVKWFNQSPLSFALIFVWTSWMGGHYALQKYYGALIESVKDVEHRTAFIDKAHQQGGMEYCNKTMDRNRILRSLLPNGPALISPAGSVKSEHPVAITRRHAFLHECEAID